MIQNTLKLDLDIKVEVPKRCLYTVILKNQVNYSERQV